MRRITEPKSKCQIMAKRRDPVSGRWLALVELDSAYVLSLMHGRKPCMDDRLLELFAYPKSYPDRFAAWQAGFRALLRRTEVPS